jgi:hypothetical protein
MKKGGCCGVRGVYHNIKCGQEEGKKANTPFIKKDLLCLTTLPNLKRFKGRVFFNTFTTQALIYFDIYLHNISFMGEDKQTKGREKGRVR